MFVVFFNGCLGFVRLPVLGQMVVVWLSFASTCSVVGWEDRFRNSHLLLQFVDDFNTKKC